MDDLDDLECLRVKRSPSQINEYLVASEALEVSLEDERRLQSYETGDIEIPSESSNGFICNMPYSRPVKLR